MNLGDDIVTKVAVPINKDCTEYQKFVDYFGTDIMKMNMWGTVIEVGKVFVTILVPFELSHDEEIAVKAYVTDKQIEVQSW